MNSIIGPILSGLVATLVVYLLMRVGKKPAAREGDRRVLKFGIGFRVFALLLVPGSLFVTYAAVHARESQLVLALCIATGFLAAAAFFAYQAFFVRLSYDDSFIYYSAPFAGRHRIPWSAVELVAWSSVLQSYYIKTSEVSRIWCSSMLQGYEEFGAFLNAKLEVFDEPER